MRLKYFLSEALDSLRRNLLMTLAAISTVSVSLFLLGGVFVLGRMVDNMAGVWENRVEINIFLRSDITAQQTKTLQQEITSMTEVEKSFYVSKEKAYKEYKVMFKHAPALYEDIGPEALPASFRVKLKNPRLVENVGERFKGRPGVDEVRFGGTAVKRLLQVNKLLRGASLVMTLILLAAAVLLIANTIRLAIFARRKEIGIMKLVGATNFFIRVPFIMEGMTQAALGALLATGVILSIKLFVLDRLQQSTFFFIPVSVGSDAILQMFLILLAVGVIIGAIGSTLALRRFLEV